MTQENILEVVQAGLNAMIGANIYPIDVGEDGNPTPVQLTYQDPDKLVDMGVKIEEAGERGVDIVWKAMVDTIGKIVIESRQYVASLPKLYYNTREFGGATEVIRTGLSDLYEDSMWDINGFINYTDPARGGLPSGKDYAAKIAQMEHATYKPKVHARLFQKATSIMCALTTLRDQLFTAFKSWDQVGTFINALYTSVENTLALKAEFYALSTVSVGIGKANAHGHEIPLVTLYNREKGVNIAAGEAALFDDDFMRFALSKIVETRDQMARFSTAFNDGEEPTFTPKNDNRLILLSRFVNAAKFNVRANTYNEQLIGIGEGYDTTVAWMGIGDTTGNFNFDAISKVMFTPDSVTAIGMEPGQMTPQGLETTEGAKTIPNIIGVMYDAYAMGIMVDKKKVTTSYTAVTDQVNSFWHALVQYFVNDSHNIAYFTLN